MEASANRLVFQWNSVTTPCEAVCYAINASNCGYCPDVTNDTTVVCTDFALDEYNQVCLLTVWTVVCDDVTGNESSSVQVNLRGTRISHLSCICNNKCDILKVPDSPAVWSMLSQHTPTVAKLY